MMSNYVQTRVAPTSKSSTSINHDLRIKKPNYLRDNMFHNQFENIYSNTNAKELRAEIKEYENEFRNLYKKRLGRNPQKGKASAFMEGIITLSNSINEMLENKEVTPTELNKLFKTALDNQLDKIEDITGTRPKLVEYSIHYDEKTPHLHYLTTNYDQQGRSLHHALKTSKRLSELQDQVGEDFETIGFKRGEKRGFTKPLSIAQMHEKEIEELKKELKAVKTKAKEQIEELKKQKKELKSVIEDKEQLKKELDYIDRIIRDARETIKNDILDIDSLIEHKINSRANLNDLDELHNKIKELNSKLETNNSNKQEEDYKLSSVPNVDATTTTKTKRRYNI